MGGAPCKKGALSVFLTSCSLTLMISEEICGRFGRFGVRQAHIGSLASAMMRVTSFTVCGSRYFGNLAHRQKIVSELRFRTDVRRFDVKDTAQAVST